MPAFMLNSSIAKCGVVPVPVWPYSNLPGLALVKSSNCRNVLPGAFGLDTYSREDTASNDTGAKSLRES